MRSNWLVSSALSGWYAEIIEPDMNTSIFRCPMGSGGMFLATPNTMGYAWQGTSAMRLTIGHSTT